MLDVGDLELCFGSAEKALGDIEAQADEILEAGKRPFLLGGEHLVTLGAMRAVAGRYPDLHMRSIWMLTPTCGTTTWAPSCPTRASSAAAGSLSVTAASSSSASARASAPSLPGAAAM